MSITSCFLLFLLCLSLHACTARRLGAVDHKNKLEKKLNFSIKNDMKNVFKKNSVVVLQATSSSSKELQYSTKEESIEESDHADDSGQRLEDAAEVNRKTVENEKGKTSGAVHQTNKSVVSVSWRVPHRKHGEKHPGFNLDYSPPKTHPPSHN
ncbi:hypothetical protein DITRI_Ditri11bG0167400 [Diplodiscus trichospermus]